MEQKLLTHEGEIGGIIAGKIVVQIQCVAFVAIDRVVEMVEEIFELVLTLDSGQKAHA